MSNKFTLQTKFNNYKNEDIANVIQLNFPQLSWGVRWLLNVVLFSIKDDALMEDFASQVFLNISNFLKRFFQHWKRLTVQYGAFLAQQLANSKSWSVFQCLYQLERVSNASSLSHLHAQLLLSPHPVCNARCRVWIFVSATHWACVNINHWKIKVFALHTCDTLWYLKGVFSFIQLCATSQFKCLNSMFSHCSHM